MAQGREEDSAYSYFTVTRAKASLRGRLGEKAPESEGSQGEAVLTA